MVELDDQHSLEPGKPFRLSTSQVMFSLWVKMLTLSLRSDPSRNELAVTKNKKCIFLFLSKPTCLEDEWSSKQRVETITLRSSYLIVTLRNR
jgi:hypothetical protein